MQWNLTTILILLGVLFAGYSIGLLENYLKYSKKLKQAQEEKQAALATPEQNPAVSQSEPSLLRLWADPARNLNLEVDGAQIESPQTATPEQRRRLVTLLTQIRPWVGGGPVAPASKPAERPAVTPAAAQPKPGTPGAAKAAAEPPSVPVVKSIVAQIDDILQSRLAGTLMAAKRIRLGETTGGGALVYVGSNHYEGIDAVPDPEVIAAIRAAISEWEKGPK